VRHQVTDNSAWVGLGGEEIKDIRELLDQLTPLREDCSLHVGVDSKNYSDYSLMVSTICLRQEGSGVIVVYNRKRQQAYKTIRERLYAECYLSLELAQAVESETGIFPTVHVDINPKEGTVSNRSYEELTGMLKGCGCNVVTKPNAWAADIADMFTR